jgi:hypothetical protein
MGNIDPNFTALIQQIFNQSGGKGEPTAKAMMDMIMSGKMGALTDTYSGGQQPQQYVASPQVAMPTAYDYLNAQGPMADIVRQMMSSDPSVHITPDGAQRLLVSQTQDSNSPLFGQDVGFLTSQLNKVSQEINDYSAANAKQQWAASQPDPNNPFVKAGLPTPDQRWTGDSVPYQMNASEAQMMAAEQARLQHEAKSWGIKQNADGTYDYSATSYKQHNTPYAGKTMYKPDEQGLLALADHLALNSGYGTTKQSRDILKENLSKDLQKALVAAGAKDGVLTTAADREAFNKHLFDIMKFGRNAFYGKYLQNVTPQQVDALSSEFRDPEFRAYDTVNNDKLKYVYAHKQDQASLKAMQDADAGYRAGMAYLMNQAGQTPTVLGIAQRLAPITHK